MSRYDGLSREELETRLAAAEDVALLFAWTGTTAGPTESDREKALTEVWQTWWGLPGVQAFADRARVEEWPEERIAELARKRDATRAAVLDRINRSIEGTETP